MTNDIRGSSDGAVASTEMMAILQAISRELNEVRAQLEGRLKDFYTVEEIAKLTGRSAYTVRTWIKESLLNAIRVSGTGPKGRLLIPRAELQKLVAIGHGGGLVTVAVPDITGGLEDA